MREFTGRSVLIWLLSAFGVVVAVNGLFLYLAIDGFPGLETENAYRRGLSFNNQIARAQALAALGWTVSVEQADNGGLTIAFRDRDGAPLTVSAVVLVLAHPENAKADLTLNPEKAGPGTYIVRQRGSVTGKRNLHVTAIGPNGQNIEVRRKLWFN